MDLRISVASLKWSSDCSVYISEVDEEHRTLFRLTEELQTALQRGDVTSAVQSIAQELVAHTAAHFATEEERMIASRYRSLSWHRQQHQGAIRKILPLLQRVESGDREAASEMVEYLAEFLR